MKQFFNHIFNIYNLYMSVFLSGLVNPSHFEIYQNNFYYTSSGNTSPIHKLDLSTNIVTDLRTIGSYGNPCFSLYNSYIYYMSGDIGYGQIVNNVFTVINNSAYSQTDPSFIAACINPGRNGYGNMHIFNSYLYLTYMNYDNNSTGVIRAYINPDGSLTNINPLFINLSPAYIGALSYIHVTTTNIYICPPYGGNIRIYNINGTLISNNWSNAILNTPRSMSVYGAYMYIGDYTGIKQINIADGTINNATWAVIDTAYSSYVYNNKLLVASNNTITIKQYTLPPIPVTNVCFIGSTPIITDQGIFPIYQITEKHTIQQNKIIMVTKIISCHEYLVAFEKDSLGLNYPSERTVMSKNHKVFYKGEMIEAEKIENGQKIDYNGELLYNILLDKPALISVNNLICESLDPNSVMARLHNSKYNEVDKDKIINLLNTYTKNNDIYSYVTAAKILLE